ncbi:MAG: hypothetical protein ACFFCW_43625 [Candidatus Hodarchaeota archaeon]
MKKGTGEAKLAKQWIIAVLVGSVLFGAGILVGVYITPWGLPFYASIIVFVSCVYPFVLLWVYLLHRMFPIGKEESFKGFKKWVSLSLFGLAIVFSFAGLDFTLERLVPTLPLEDRGLISLMIIAFTIIVIAFASQRYGRHR